MALDPQSRYRARLYRMIALIQVGPPYLEAEREAQTHATWADPTARPAFFDAIRLIDECADSRRSTCASAGLAWCFASSCSPQARRRHERWTPEERAELRLRLTRAYLFLGDEASARASLRGWTGPPRSAGDDFLRDLADTYNRLEAYELAIDVQRLRSKNLPAGSVSPGSRPAMVWPWPTSIPASSSSPPSSSTPRHPSPRSRRRNDPEEVHPAPAAAGGAAVTRLSPEALRSSASATNGRSRRWRLCPDRRTGNGGRSRESCHRNDELARELPPCRNRPA